MKRRMRLKRLSEPDRALLNSILVSRANERDTHLWRGTLQGEDWVADVLWDDGALLGPRVVLTGDLPTSGDDAWQDYQAKPGARGQGHGHRSFLRHSHSRDRSGVRAAFANFRLPANKRLENVGSVAGRHVEASLHQLFMQLLSLSCLKERPPARGLAETAREP